MESAYKIVSREAAIGAKRFQRRLWGESGEVRLVGTPSSWDTPFVTTTVDQKGRVLIPFKPGDVLEIERQSPDIVVLKRTRQVKSAPAKLVRRKGRLLFVGESITTQDVKTLLEDFP